MVLEHGSLTDFGGIPMSALRENSLTELDLQHEVRAHSAALARPTTLLCTAYHFTTIAAMYAWWPLYFYCCYACTHARQVRDDGVALAAL